MELKYIEIAEFIREKFNKKQGTIALHEPVFIGNEKKYLADCIDTSFVSSVGKYVNIFEELVAKFTGAKYAIAVVNGTAALHIALMLSGITPDDEVITQALTFVATANAISYTGAKPIFVDVDIDTMGLSPEALESFLKTNTETKNGFCFNKFSGKRIKACVPMHTFGHPCKIDKIVSICNKYNIDLIEDSTESLGSYFLGQHTGTFGNFGVLSFNGNKIITTGGGGMILTNDVKLAKLARHITTTAKIPHQWEFNHDMIAYNYRLTNLSAALGCAQMEQLPTFLTQKRKLAQAYSSYFEKTSILFFKEPKNCLSNYWLNAIILSNKEEQQKCLTKLNNKDIMARPVWKLMNELEMYKHCQHDLLENTSWLAERVVNIPSSAIDNL